MMSDNLLISNKIIVFGKKRITNLSECRPQKASLEVLQNQLLRMRVHLSRDILDRAEPVRVTSAPCMTAIEQVSNKIR